MGSENQKKRSKGVLDYLRAKSKLWLLFGGVIAGVFLLLIGSSAQEGAQKANTVDQEAVYEDAADLDAYQERLESELELMCESVAGVSQADVMVTLGSGCRIVYVTDEDGEVVTTGTGSARKPVYRTLQPPTVVGVGVVCKGGGNAHVQRALTDLISTTLKCHIKCALSGIFSVINGFAQI